MGQPRQAGAPAPPVRTVAVRLSDVGQARDHNEDSVAIEIPGHEALRVKGALYLVADGMGGYQAGEVASQRAAGEIIGEYYADPQTDIATSLSQAMHRANATVHEMAQADLQLVGMGTTAVAAVVRGPEVHIANVGDSRAYLLRGGTMSQITRDHSFVQDQIDAGILDREAARVHPQRNVITRALGHKPQVEVDTFAGELMPGDLLLLCSDGLSGPLRDEEIKAILSQYPPHEAVIHLIDEANRRGGPDNISAVLVQALPHDPALAAAIEVAPGAAVPAPPPAPRAAREAARPAGGRGCFIPLGVFGALLLIILLGGGGLLLFRGGSDSEATLAPTLTATLAPPTPESTSPVAPTSTPVTPTASEEAPPATATPEAGGGEPTSTFLPPTSTPTPTPTPTPCWPALPELVAPSPGMSFALGADVTFQWEEGRLCPGHAWMVTIIGEGGSQNCEPTQDNSVTCPLDLPEGGYQWQVEIRLWDGRPLRDMTTPSQLIIITVPAPEPPPPQDEPQPQPGEPTPTPQREGG